MQTAISASNDPAMPTCPKCASRQIEHGPAFTAIVDKYAPSIHGNAVRPHLPEGATEVIVNAPVHSHAANPRSIRCVNCGSAWDESDTDATGARFAFLKAEYAKNAIA
jgi:hypothetical protein